MAERPGEPASLRQAVFVDRDGTVILEADYLADPGGVELVEGSAGAIRRLRRAGLAVVIVTNQSGIARGLYDESDYRAVDVRLRDMLRARGAGVDGSYHCPHHPDFTGPCECRKPGTGMHRSAAADLALDLGRSYYVGDKPADVEPAARLGGQGILVRTGYGLESEDRVDPAVHVVDDLAAAADWILGVGRERTPRARTTR